MDNYSSEQTVHVGKNDAASFVRDFIQKHSVALITDGAAYKLSGAADLLEPIINDTVHIVVKTPNPQVEIVQAMLSSLRGKTISAIIAVGGGTSIDTAKLLNLALSAQKDIPELLAELPKTFSPLPYLAVPTTAGTGAEATRFAVCYDGETKHSVDIPELRPSHVLLIPEFSVSLPSYQTASTHFDAYAQAIESLWAKDATEESRLYANRALDLMKQNDWAQGSYWAGRAIDLSRTTAAHAFSYYLTSHYGIPHGHAVYMVFPYICKNNGHPEFIREVPELKTLREFATERSLEWNLLVDDLFNHVNLKRLGNNPVEVSKESFYG